MQDRIKLLCRRLMESQDEKEAHCVAQELQQALHDHLEMLRLTLLSKMGGPPHDTDMKLL